LEECLSKSSVLFGDPRRKLITSCNNHLFTSIPVWHRLVKHSGKERTRGDSRKFRQFTTLPLRFVSIILLKYVSHRTEGNVEYILSHTVMYYWWTIPLSREEHTSCAYEWFSIISSRMSIAYYIFEVNGTRCNTLTHRQHSNASAILMRAR
jgi:hypothetical protein